MEVAGDVALGHRVMRQVPGLEQTVGRGEAVVTLIGDHHMPCFRRAVPLHGLRLAFKQAELLEDIAAPSLSIPPDLAHYDAPTDEYRTGGGYAAHHPAGG